MRPQGAPGRGRRADQEALTPRRPALVVIGLGGNLGGEGEIAARFAAAARLVGRLGYDLTRSALYRTEPWGPVADQPRFLNAALAMRPRPGLKPLGLLVELWRAERALGRRRPVPLRFGPRPIDLDILVWGRRRVDLPALQIPHPRLAGRLFALEPLADVAGADFRLPDGATVGELITRARTGGADSGGA